MTEQTPRPLDCGKSVEELSDYLGADRIPFDPTIENCPECLDALQVLGRLSQLSRDLLAQDVADMPPPPTGWMQEILKNIHSEVRAGRSLPLHHPDPRVTLTLTEGAVRGLIRTVGDEIPGIVIGTCRFEGDLERPGAPVEVTVTASVAWAISIPDVAETLRGLVRDTLAEHTELDVTAINIAIEDLHGYPGNDNENTNEERP